MPHVDSLKSSRGKAEQAVEPAGATGLMKQITALAAAASPHVRMTASQDRLQADIVLLPAAGTGRAPPHGRIAVMLSGEDIRVTVVQAALELAGARSYAMTETRPATGIAALGLIADAIIRHLAGRVPGSRPAEDGWPDGDDDIFYPLGEAAASPHLPVVEKLVAAAPPCVMDVDGDRIRISVGATGSAVTLQHGRFQRGPRDQPWRQVAAGEGVRVEVWDNAPDGSSCLSRVLHVPDGHALDRLVRAELLHLGGGQADVGAAKAGLVEGRPSMVQSVFQDIFAQTRESIRQAEDRVEATHREIRARLDVVEGLLEDLAASVGEQNCRIASDAEMVVFRLWPRTDATPGRQEVRFEIRTQLRIYDRDIVDIPGYTFKQAGGVRRHYSFEERFEDSAAVMMKLMEAVAYEVAKTGSL